MAPINFTVSSCCQNIPFYEYELPAVWKTKYNLCETPGSACGANMITVGKDNCAFFPTVLQIVNGVCLSKSNITGKFIMSGRASTSSEETVMDNRIIICNNTNLEMTVDAQTTLPISSSGHLDRLSISSSGQLKPPAIRSSGVLGPLTISSCAPVTISSSDVQKLLPWASGKNDTSKKILNEITTDSINVPPVKKVRKVRRM